MPNLIVEDGTMPTGANSYASVSDADAYHASRGLTAWAAATTADKEAALVKATDYLNGLAWHGSKVDKRVMAWPRHGAEDDGWIIASNVVPGAVVSACCEAAGAILSGVAPLAVQDRSMSSIKDGPVNIEYEQGAPQAPRLPAVESLLKGLIQSRGSIRMVQA